MLKFIVRRVLLMIPTLMAVSILAFLIIQAPPGTSSTPTWLGSGSSGRSSNRDRSTPCATANGLNQPVHVQYWKWMSG